VRGILNHQFIILNDLTIDEPYGIVKMSLMGGVNMFDIIQQDAYAFNHHEEREIPHFNSSFHLIPDGHKLWTITGNSNEGTNHLNIHWENSSRMG
jgi:hypothetical protein